MKRIYLLFSVLMASVSSFAQYSEDFETAPGGGSSVTPAGWVTWGTEPWKFTNSGASGPGWGVAGTNDHTTGSGIFAWIDASTGIGTNGLVSPFINFSGSAPHAGFWLMSNNVDDGAQNIISLEANDGNGWVMLGTYSGNNAGWIKVDFPVPVTIASPARFRMRQSVGTSGGSAYYNDLLIDDFFVEDYVCFSPFALSISSVSAFTGDLSWAPASGASGYNIEWGVSGYTVGIGQEIGSTTTTTINSQASGLTPETTYDVYVQTDCPAGVSAWVGPITFTTLPLCAEPTSVVSSSGALDANITWDFGGTESNWNVEYGPVGFPLGSGTTDPISGSPVDPISGLNQLTCYHYYVQANCIAVSAKSLWVGPLQFCTVATCLEPSVVSSNVLSADSVEIDWTVGGSETEWTISYGTPGFVAGSGLSLVADTHPDTLFGLMFDTDYEYYIQANCGAADASIWVGPFTFTTDISCAEVSTITMTSVTIDSAYIMWAAGATETSWNVEYGIDGYTPGTGTMSVETTTDISIGNLTAGTEYDFYVQAICGAGDLAQWVGPFDFMTVISCPQPTFLNAINISNSSANLLFQAGGSEGEWNIEWGEIGFTVDNNEELGMVSNTTDNPHYITGLSTCGTYSYYVQASCGAGDLSTWSGPYTFSTLSGLVSAPFYENFDGLTTGPTAYSPPNCWNNPNVGERWEFQSSGGTGPGYGVQGTVDHTSGSGNYAWIDASGSIGNNRLVTPWVDLTTIANTAHIGFWILSNNVTDGAQNTISLEARVGSNSWITVGVYSGNNPEWTKVDFVLPLDFILTTTRFRIVQNTSTNGSGIAQHNDLLIDDFYIIDGPICTAVDAGNPVADLVCANSDGLNLFDAISDYSVNDGTWYYPSATDVNTQSFPSNNGAALLTGLDEGVDYTFDYVVNNACSTDTVSTVFNWSNLPNAGNDGSVTSCVNHIVVLIQELTGNVEFGGDWSDVDNAGGLVNGIVHPVNVTAGTYDYSYVVTNGSCTDTAIVTVTYDDCLGVEANEASSLEVYPNPVADVLTIANLSIDGDATITLLNIQGKVVYTKTISNVNGNYELDLSKFENGIYVIEVTSELDTQKVRVVKH